MTLAGGRRAAVALVVALGMGGAGCGGGGAASSGQGGAGEGDGGSHAEGGASARGGAGGVGAGSGGSGMGGASEGGGPGAGGAGAGGSATGGTAANGGASGGPGGGPDARAGEDTAHGSGGSGGPGILVWPNEVSYANSDPWLRQHHDEIRELHPRMLVINFANNRTLASVMARYEAQKAAMMEGTRYHGYNDPSAKPFLIYELAKLVDLTDATIPPGWAFPNSTKMPRRNGGIDFGALFNQTYADHYGFKDPKNPAHNLTLCELFARGIVNDIFVVFNKTGADGNVPEILEYKQMYDDSDVAKPGKFNRCAGNGCFEPQDLPAVNACGRSVRIDFLEMTGVLGNAMQVNAHNYEHIGQRALPHFNKMFLPFANFDMNTRYGTPFADWYGECPNGARACISYSGMNSVTWHTAGTTELHTIEPFNQGCGNGHFPPNGRENYDQTNTQTVLSTCEHYGLHDGPGGKDIQTPYDVTTLNAWKAKYGVGPTGGAWYMYWFQSWPGLDNKAKLPDGTPMKNWWVYLYY